MKKYGPGSSPVWIWLVAVLLLAALPYSPMITAGYVWDDLDIQRWLLKSFQSLQDAFYPPSSLVAGLTKNYYRPVVFLSYMLDRAVAGAGTATAASWAHAVNIALHAAASVLVFMLGLRVFSDSPKRLWAAAAGAAVFALQPVHAESVCNIAGRSDILAAVFVLGAVLAALACRGRGLAAWAFAVLSSFLCFLGLLSKESAVAAFGIVPLAVFCFAFKADEKFRPAPAQLGMALLLPAAGAGYWLLRASAMAPLGGEQSVPLGQMLARILAACCFYMQKSIIPWPQYHYIPNIPEMSPWAIALPAAAVFALWRAAKNCSMLRSALFSLCLFVFSLAPALAVVVRVLSRTPVAERYLYLPTAAVGLLLGVFVAQADFKKISSWAIIAAAGIIIAAYGISIVERTGTWQSDLAFWQDAMRNQAAAHDPIVLCNLGQAYQDRDEIDSARRCYQRAYDLFTTTLDRIKVAFNLATLELAEGQKYRSRHQPQQAIERFDRAIASIEPFLQSPLSVYGRPHAALANVLLLKYMAQVEEWGFGDRALLKRAREQAAEASKTISNADLDSIVQECERLMMENQARQQR